MEACESVDPQVLDWIDSKQEQRPELKYLGSGAKAKGEPEIAKVFKLAEEFTRDLVKALEGVELSEEERAAIEALIGIVAEGEGFRITTQIPNQYVATCKHCGASYGSERRLLGHIFPLLVFHAQSHRLELAKEWCALPPYCEKTN